MIKFIIIAVLLLTGGCTSLDKDALKLESGMSKDEVMKILGVPVNSSFNGKNEAWQYQGIAGFGQCTYTTAWFEDGVLVASTNRRGSSIAGCGLGSREVDWGQMPKNSLDVDLTIQ